MQHITGKCLKGLKGLTSQGWARKASGTRSVQERTEPLAQPRTGINRTSWPVVNIPGTCSRGFWGPNQDRAYLPHQTFPLMAPSGQSWGSENGLNQVPHRPQLPVWSHKSPEAQASLHFPSLQTPLAQCTGSSCGQFKAILSD